MPDAAPTELEVPDATVSAETLPAAPDDRRPPFGVVFWLCTGWLGALAAVSVLASLLPLDDPSDSGNFSLNFGPTWQHLLGTDELGRDILSRFIHGAQVSLTIGICATAIGITLGGGLGMLSAYLRGRFDATLSLFMYSGLAFPAIIAVVAILSFWGSSEWHIVVVLGLFSVPLIFRLVRAATLSCATKEYVTAARSQGATAWRVLGRDIFPNVAPSLIAYTVFTLGGVIATEGALAFLGLSVAVGTASWGAMISEATSVDQNRLMLLLVPAMGLFLTLISLNYIGERLRVHFDTTESKL